VDYTSRKAARYHFVPDFEGDDLSKPVWRLEARLDDEGYTPRYGTFHELPVQIARFGRGDSMLVAVASTVGGTPLSEQLEASAHLILSDGPGQFPVELTSALHEERAVFLAQTPRQRYVTSLEVLSEGVYGRHRVVTHGLEGGVSDLLLYDPVGTYLPDELHVAVGMMRGTTVLEVGDRPGLYWEVYGAPEGTPVRLELAVEGEGRGGVIGWLGRLFGGGEGHRGSWSWEEASPDEAVFAKAIHLDLGELKPGAYALALRASWPGQDEPVETRRAFEVR
jgi:hypothetical protein